MVPWFLFGIRATAPGFASVQIRPRVGQLTAGSYALPTVRGTVNVAFSQTAADFVLDVTLPAGVSGVVILPCANETASIPAGLGPQSLSCKKY